MSEASGVGEDTAADGATEPLAHESLRFDVGGGVELVADAWGDADAQPVVLLHGGGQTRHAWSGTGRTLARAGWYAVAVDQRGHGESAWAPDGDYEPQRFAADVVDVARRLPAPPVLVGASLGGMASLQAIDMAAPGVARGLVLVDIATRMESDGIARIFEFMTAKPEGFASLEEAADAVAAYNHHRRRPEDVSGLAKNLRRGEDGRWRWHWDPRFLAGKHVHKVTGPERTRGLDEMVRRLAVPTLLVRGRMSDVLSEEGARHFLSLAPHAAYADITDAGHMVAGDRNDAFTEAVVDFLRRARLGPGRAT